MAIMDLTVNQGLMGVQKKHEREFGNYVLNFQETFQETETAGNNNIIDSLKTEAIGNHACNPKSLLKANQQNINNCGVGNSLLSYSSFKKAMDLSIHNRKFDEVRRTIFDDAEYFGRNYSYKLLPITFEQVDETIIHTEHNYSLRLVDSGSETEGDCSRTMNYFDIKEKNYKKRKTKTPESNNCDEKEVDKKCIADSILVLSHPEDRFSPQPQEEHRFASDEDNPFPGQPLDLSTPPAVQDKKTEAPISIFEEIAQLDSDKENAGGELSGVRVTITRPDEKNSYQPCDLFLNDIARLVPWLIDKNCLEVDILDRTCNRHEDFPNHRLYYVIAESTWQSFQNTSERIILTNDPNLGQPLSRVEREEKPSYLVFDQFSLAKCLAEYCQEIGGCFEYTCVEEGSDRAMELLGVRKGNVMDGKSDEKVEEDTEEAKVSEESPKRGNRDESEESLKEGNVMEIKNFDEKKGTEKSPKEDLGLSSASEKSELLVEVLKKAELTGITPSEAGNQAKEHINLNEEMERDFVVFEGVKSSEETHLTLKSLKKTLEGKRRKNKPGGNKRRKIPSRQIQNPKKSQKQVQAHPKLNNFRIATRSRSTSEVETSQTSDKRVSRKENRKRLEATPVIHQPPKKRRRTPKPEVGTVTTAKSAAVSEMVKTSSERRKKRKPEVRKNEKREEKKGKGNQNMNKRILRSRRTKSQEKQKEGENLRGKKNEKRVPSGKSRKR